MYMKWELTCCNHINTVYASTANTQKYWKCVPSSSHTFNELFQPVTKSLTSLFSPRYLGHFCEIVKRSRLILVFFDILGSQEDGEVRYSGDVCSAFGSSTVTKANQMTFRYHTGRDDHIQNRFSALYNYSTKKFFTSSSVSELSKTPNA